MIDTRYRTALPPTFQNTENKANTEIRYNFGGGYGYGYNYGNGNGYTYTFDYGNGYTATVTEKLTPVFSGLNAQSVSVNMGGRVYDPLVSQFLSPDPFIQTPGNWLNYNRYGYVWNNPLIYTDPSGEFLGLAFRALSFVGESLSNLIHGYSNPIKKAWKFSGDMTNAVSNSTQIPVYRSDNTLITAGLDPFALGVSVNGSHSFDNGLTVGGNAGYGLLGGFSINGSGSYDFGDWAVGASVGGGKNHWGWNARATYKEYGLSYGRTYYGNATVIDDVPNKQIVGNWSILWDGGSFTLQNDVGGKPFGIPIGGDREDRWRTNAFELTIGDFSFGNYINTNFGRLVSEASFGEGDRAIDTDAEAPFYGKHPHAGKGAWKAGEVFSAPAWIGYRVGGQISRVGYSHRFFQNLFQNGIHTTRFGSQNYYLLYTNFNKGAYGYCGYYNPFSLWGY